MELICSFDNSVHCEYLAPTVDISNIKPPNSLFHFIDFSREENCGKRVYLNFSIDFEPIRIIVDENFIDRVFRPLFGFYYGISGKNFWETMINICCDILGKEHRSVLAMQNTYNMGTFDATVYEYLSETNNGWTYFLLTKTYHINKYYKWFELVRNQEYSSDTLLEFIPNTDDFYSHYSKVHRYLTEQKLTASADYHHVSNTIIDNLIKTLLK